MTSNTKPKLQVVARSRNDCPCGNEPIKYRKHGLGANCYNVYRHWDMRPDEDRDRYKARLALAQLRQSWVDSALISINHLKETPREKARASAKQPAHSVRRRLR